MFSWFKKHRLGGHSNIDRESRGGLSASAPDLTEEEDTRQPIQLEKICNHGFPISPSCMEYDHHHKLLMVGTSTGELRVLGRPGVELSGFHDEVTRVLQILPVVDEPSFITICSGNMLHKWSFFNVEKGESELVLQQSYKLAGGSPKTITVACLPPHSDSVFVGTLGGITYPIDVHLYGMSPEIIAPSRARERLRYRGEKEPGAVQCIELNPVQKRQLLIGHEENYFELWDVFATKPLKIITPTMEVGYLSSMAWHLSGTKFMSGHKDGTVLQFAVETEKEEEHVISEKKFFDSNDCRDVSHILWPSDNVVVFSGGVPMDVVDSDCVTVSDGQDMVTLQLTSGIRTVRIIEDQVVDMDSGMIDVGSDNEASVHSRRIMILLLEQEILFLELSMPDLPILLQPYLHSLHNSPVKTQVVYSDVRPEVWQLIEKAGTLQTSVIYPAHVKAWPIEGGHTDSFSAKHKRDLLITGHEDGTVKFWDISQVYFRLVYILKSAQYFNVEEDRPDSVNDRLPNSRTVGFWDPRGDDERLMVTSICLDGWNLTVGYHGGQVLVFNLNNQKAKHTIKAIRVTLMKDYMSLHPSLWTNPLAAKSEDQEFDPGYQPSHCFQLLPTSSVTTLAVLSESKLVAVGSYYGFAVVDLVQSVCNLVHTTYDPDQPEQNITRLQSIRKSFRQSLRRFNLRRSLRASQSARRTLRPGQLQRGASSRGGSLPATARLGTVSAPLKRDSIRTLVFTPPIQAHGAYPISTLWVGTGLGSVLSYYIEMPSDAERDLKAVNILPLEKEYGKKRQFATLFVGVLDGHSMLSDRTLIHTSKYHHRPDSKMGHHHSHNQYVVVCTEEEVRVVSLHSAKRKHKIKLKLNEEDGYHMVSAHYVRVKDQPVIMVLDTEGYIHVFSLPDLKPLYKAWCLDGADAVGQRSFISTPTGLVLHMRSPSEFARLALTEEARCVCVCMRTCINVSECILLACHCVGKCV